jgi:hypothetical protein
VREGGEGESVLLGGCVHFVRDGSRGVMGDGGTRLSVLAYHAVASKGRRQRSLFYFLRK